MTIDRRALGDLWQQAFGDSPEWIEGFFRAGFSPKRFRCVQSHGRLAAALYWFDCRWENRKIAYIYGVATDRDFRGQGLCRRLMEDTHRYLKKLGYAGAALVPGNAGLFAMYEKLGYRGFCPMETKTLFSAEPRIAVQAVTPETYGDLRKTLMPAGGIAQGEETLAFFAVYGQFYTYDGGAFCAAREKNTLHIQEFLGDAAALPGILTSLGAEKASVRLPGGHKPFAMYRSFTGEDTLPGYLGIALD